MFLIPPACDSPSRYLNNPNNHLVNFSLILQSHASGSWFPTSELGGNETLDQETSRYVRYFQMPNYQKVGTPFPGSNPVAECMERQPIVSNCAAFSFTSVLLASAPLPLNPPSPPSPWSAGRLV